MSVATFLFIEGMYYPKKSVISMAQHLKSFVHVRILFLKMCLR